MLYCIVGPSGCGKSTIVEELNKLGYKSPDSYTTRPKRYPDEKGHTFISDDEFDKLEDILAYTVFNNYRYCVTRNMLEGCNFYIIDPAGVETLKKNNFTNFKVIGLILNPSDCANRMLSRGDTEQDVKKRLEHDRHAFKDFDKICDFKINATKTLSTIIEEILKIIKQ